MYEEYEFDMATEVAQATHNPRRNAEKRTTDALYMLDALTAPVFRIGQGIYRGEQLGQFGMSPVTSFRDGIITSIEYDGWRNEVIVGVRSIDAALNEQRPGTAGALQSLVS